MIGERRRGTADRGESQADQAGTGWMLKGTGCRGHGGGDKRKSCCEITQECSLNVSTPYIRAHRIATLRIATLRIATHYAASVMHACEYLLCGVSAPLHHAWFCRQRHEQAWWGTRGKGVCAARHAHNCQCLATHNFIRFGTAHSRYNGQRALLSGQHDSTKRGHAVAASHLLGPQLRR